MTKRKKSKDTKNLQKLMEIADKDFLNGTVHILHIFKKVKETMYIQRREWKNIFKNPDDIL